MKKSLLLFFAGIVVLGNVQLQAQNCSSKGTLLDNWQTASSMAITDVGSDRATSVITGPNIVGTERDEEIICTPAIASSSVQSNILSGIVEINAGSTYMISGNITYDGADASPGGVSVSPGLGGLNMMGQGVFGTEMNTDAITAGKTLTFTYRVFSDLTHYSDKTFSYTGIPGMTGSVPMFASRLEFGTGSGAAGPADFSSVRAVQIRYNTTQNGQDIRLSNGFYVPCSSLLTPVISNVACNPGSNLHSPADDFIQFSLLANSPSSFYEAPNTYTLTATQNGNPVTVLLSDGTAATSVLFDALQPYPFKLAPGTSGNGDVTLTLTPNFGSYPAKSFVLTDPGSCAVVACSGTSPKTVSYTYTMPISTTNVTNIQPLIPKFDLSGGKTLTGVQIVANSGIRSSGIYESLGFDQAMSVRLRFRPYYSFNGTANPYNEYLVFQNPDYPATTTIPNAISVPAQGNWTGDIAGSSGSLSTLAAMTWVGDALQNGFDPLADPRWVTNATAMAITDHDMWHSALPIIVNDQQTFNYTSVADIAAFSGTGNIPFTYSETVPTSIGGGNFQTLTNSKTFVSFTVTYTYTETCQMVSGNVFHDPNAGNVNNSTGSTNVVPSGMVANLINSDGLVIGTATVNTDGTYSFPSVAPGNYIVSLSTTAGSTFAAPPLAALPSGWVNTGEYNGTPNTGSDATVNGISSSFTVVAGTDYTNVNFGIQQPPTSQNLSYVIPQPTGGTFLALNGTGATSSPGPLQGSDPEDKPVTGSLSGTTIQISTLPTENELYYDGVLVTAGQVITNYDPGKLQVKFTTPGSTSVSFNYSYIDQAGAVSTPTTYTISWASPLPITGLELRATLINDFARLTWTTETESNVDRFEVEKSADAINFTKIDYVKAAGNTTSKMTYNYQDMSEVKGVAFYRIKAVDGDGKFYFSNIEKIQTGKRPITLVPTLLNGNSTTVYGLSEKDRVSVYNSVGQLVAEKIANGYEVKINLDGQSSGVYFVIVSSNSQKKFSSKIVKK